MNARTKQRERLKRWLADESGMEAVQSLMILAIAAVAMLVLKNGWAPIKNFFLDVMRQIRSEGD